MLNIIKEFNNKYPFLKIIIGFIIIGIPLIIGILIWAIPFGIGDNNSWLSFWGVWLGGIVGSSVSIIGIYLTLQYNEKQFKKTMEGNRTQYEEDKVLSLMPHLKPSIIRYDSRNDCNSAIYFNNTATEINFHNSERRKDLRISLKNIGIGSALGIKLKIGSYIGTVPLQANNFTMDLGVNDTENISLSLFSMEDERYELELEYTDILGKHTYIQSGMINCRASYEVTITMNPIKSKT